MAPADYFLFPRVKADLAGVFLDAETFKTRWDGVVNTITKKQFGEAYQKWVHCHEKCVQLDGDYVEKKFNKRFFFLLMLQFLFYNMIPVLIRTHLVVLSYLIQ